MLNKNMYQIFYQISEIYKLLNGEGYEKLIPTFSSSAMKVYPHQIAETMYALDSREKGLILGNEVGLGKTFASMIFISQNYIEGKKILIVTPLSLNLMQNGFSRRSWLDLPKDTYKGNGRVRHEYFNITISHLINVQVHSYQSKEIKDRQINNIDVGEVEHFDIFIFRNVDLIGGKPFEKITLKDLCDDDQNLGYNELARERCLLDFLDDKKGGTSIYEQELGILILSKIYEEMSIKYLGQREQMNFKI